LKILFLGKKDDNHTLRALEFLRLYFLDVTSCLGRWGNPLPDEAKDWKGDIIISYLSRWVVPEFVIANAGIAAINFHPGPPEYPGIGCNNFALYNSEKEYGVTCHHMSKDVDTGKIIAVKRFAVMPKDNVESLLSRTYDYQLCLFYEEIFKFITSGHFSMSEETWGRLPYTRKEFNELFEIAVDMNEEEIARRVRAVSFKQFQPYLAIQGYRFILCP